MVSVGHLTKYPDGLSGERGIYYNYILASNGLFIEAESPLIAARIPVAECEVRGLAPMESTISIYRCRIKPPAVSPIRSGIKSCWISTPMATGRQGSAVKTIRMR
ncbi:hypothetical protein ES705_17353 [subsurface metagenome]